MECGTIEVAATVCAARPHDTEKRRFPMSLNSTTCNHPHDHRSNLCWTCYSKERQRLSVESVKVRFWGRVLKTPTCWIWQGARAGGRYPAFKLRGQQVDGHRLAYEWANGPIPIGFHVLHTCDNPPCVNPAHLFLGTEGDNARDKERKGRGRYGKRTHCPAGHPYDEKNTYIYRGWRHCWICKRLAYARWRAKKERT